MINIHVFSEPKPVYKDLVFKNTCPKVMKDWIEFCRYHHRYTVEKLEKFFPEYLVIS